MIEPSQPKSPRPTVRSVLPAVVGMLAGWSAGKAADAAVIPSLGYWGAFAVGLVTAAVVAPLIGIPLYFWLDRGK